MNRDQTKDAVCAIGLMNGTSMDGMDAIALRLTAEGDIYSVSKLGFARKAFPAKWKSEIRAILDTPELVRSQRFAKALSDFAFSLIKQVLRDSGSSFNDLDVIGFHGQTVFHDPIGSAYLGKRRPITIQLADISNLAYLCNTAVVGNFRPADIAAGGQGAPFACRAHRSLFGQKGRRVAVQNLGGIGNVSLLHGNDLLLAFDTGPANMWIDLVTSWVTKGRRTFDRGGQIALKGTANPGLLKDLLRNPFFSKPPPKSTGWETFGAPFLKGFKKRLLKLRKEDAVRTVTEASCQTISTAYQKWILSKGQLDSLILCGGGARNPMFKILLAQSLSDTPIISSEDLGIEPEEVEAASFALLAVDCLRGRPGNEPTATGAREPVPCGNIAWPTSVDRIDRLRRLLLL